MGNNLTGEKKYSWFYAAGLVLVFIFSFSYIFNEKLDLNGDNMSRLMFSLPDIRC